MSRLAELVRRGAVDELRDGSVHSRKCEGPGSADLSVLLSCLCDLGPPQSMRTFLRSKLCRSVHPDEDHQQVADDGLPEGSHHSGSRRPASIALSVQGESPAAGDQAEEGSTRQRSWSLKRYLATFFKGYALGADPPLVLAQLCTQVESQHLSLYASDNAALTICTAPLPSVEGSHPQPTPQATPAYVTGLKRRMCGGLDSGQGIPQILDMVLAWVGAFVSILIISVLRQWTTSHTHFDFLVASFGCPPLTCPQPLHLDSCNSC